MSALSKNATWYVVSPPLEKTIVGYCTVYTMKYLLDCLLVLLCV